MPPYPSSPPPHPNPTSFDLILKHGHPDLVQCIAFNAYGDRSATGSVDGRVRVFNRARDGVWRFHDVWAAHPAEVLDLQWLPPTIHPNLIASLGVEGRFKLWAEDPGAVAGRRFANTFGPGGAMAGPGGGGRGGGGGAGLGQGRDATPKAAFETRSARSVYRSFSMKHNDETRHTYLALLAADGHLTVFENEQVENLSDYNNLDDWNVFGNGGGGGAAGASSTQGGALAAGAVSGQGNGYSSTGRPARGEETSFRVRFDPNPEVCYTALRAGVPTDALGLVVAAMDRVLVYRTRDTVTSQMGIVTSVKEFYLAAELPGHKGLVRDVAWAPGNIRGYDVIATACQDGFVRVFKLETPINPNFESSETNGKGWSSSVLRKHAKHASADEDARAASDAAHPQSGIRAGLDRSRSSADRRSGGQPGQIKHIVREISKLDSHRTPVWRVGFDDDGQILGSVGDDGKLMCYRQTPDGTWAKSAELAMMKMKMAVPDR
ncbi:WD domain-containing protein [Coniochaeta sp. PMI_546]|nr:WD domain-containing protein [Coniochaeta sp. PMI_546]